MSILHKRHDLSQFDYRILTMPGTAPHSLVLREELIDTSRQICRLRCVASKARFPGAANSIDEMPTTGVTTEPRPAPICGSPQQLIELADLLPRKFVARIGCNDR
jgi:hypothetical protein